MLTHTRSVLGTPTLYSATIDRDLSSAEPLAMAPPMITQAMAQQQAIISSLGEDQCLVALPVGGQKNQAILLPITGISATAVEWWAPGNGGYELSIASAWYHQLPRFAAISRHVHFPHGSGLPGRSWAIGAPLVVNNVERCRRFLRGSGATNEGLNQALAIPVIVGQRLHGVLVILGGREVHLARLLEIWQAHAGDHLLRTAYLAGSAHHTCLSSDHLRLPMDAAHAVAESWRHGLALGKNLDHQSQAEAMRADYLNGTISIPFPGTGTSRAVLHLGH